jgi:hypothetical protein
MGKILLNIGICHTNTGIFYSKYVDFVGKKKSFFLLVDKAAG